MSDLVIKVKYGDTLRRFSVDVNEDGLIDLNMAVLKVKILSLFKFSPNADLSLTYIDEDKDVVTLVDDDDLRDAIKQCLNPLRVNVSLNNTRAGRYDTRSSGNSTPMRSPRLDGPSFPHINSGVSEVLKTVQEPLRDALSMLSCDLAAKAASSAPLLTELVDILSKFGLSHLSSVSHCDDVPFKTEGGAPENLVVTRVAEDPKSSKESAHVQNANAANQTSVGDKKECDSDVTRGVGNSAPKTATSVDLNLDTKYSIPPEFSATGFTDCTAFGTSFYPHQPSLIADAAKLPFPAMDTRGGSSVLGGDSNKQFPTVYLPKNLCTCPKKQLPTGFEHSSMSQVGFNPQSKCPFSGQTRVDSSDGVPPGGYNPFHPSKRSYSHWDKMDRIFHKGVRCDGCGVHPITGPRFKSKVKEDYDLCSICYSEMGNEAEYIRMDHPIPYRSPRLFKEFYDLHHRFPTTSLPHIPQGCGTIPCRPKLDSHFIQDMNVTDGTMMAPETPFTKIWRMRNNGTIVWPLGTQLVWIGGDKFTHKVSVDLEIPVDGFPVDKELDIAVDFKAPQHPGRYVSYWRMASPSGQKFGQRVWVLIQVDTSEDSLASSLNGLNLNLPPESNVANGPEIIDVNVEPVDSSYQESGRFMGKELVNVIDEHRNKDQALDFPVNDSLLVGSGVSVPVNPAVPASVSYPIIDLFEEPFEPSSVMDMDTSAEETESNVVEQTLLKELEEMGFKQIDLNKEILRINKYSLEQSVEDLCGFVEWDPMLEELQEMGFCDTDTNKKLLIKNGGSIRQVVMDLVAGERAE
ncbi:hypothetical protein NE237_006835 [Protea cynaroides]|uniref:Protein NBR1 homolog n=1 Tax=Protea cynaroides TaxID=273540 RepID=A0A9Q0KN96_9MAGN|nr:hypothetical protein NE237_006835 [Protea cynaroides]